jgi:hypothetical protein
LGGTSASALASSTAEEDPCSGLGCDPIVILLGPDDPQEVIPCTHENPGCTCALLNDPYGGKILQCIPVHNSGNGGFDGGGGGSDPGDAEGTGEDSEADLSSPPETPHTGGHSGSSGGGGSGPIKFEDEGEFPGWLFQRWADAAIGRDPFEPQLPQCDTEEYTVCPPAPTDPSSCAWENGQCMCLTEGCETHRKSPSTWCNWEVTPAGRVVLMPYPAMCDLPGDPAWP